MRALGKMLGKTEATTPKRSNKTVPRRSATETVLLVQNGFSGASLGMLFSSEGLFGSGDVFGEGLLNDQNQQPQILPKLRTSSVLF